MSERVRQGLIRAFQKAKTLREEALIRAVWRRLYGFDPFNAGVWL